MTNKNNVIVIIGGGLKKDKDGKWRTTNYFEGDNFAVQGDRLRVEAGACLFNKNPEYLIITSAGKGQYKDIPDVLPVAEVVKTELVELGVTKEKIITETKSGNSYEQLRETGKIIDKMGFNQVIIISNRYHLPRLEAMIKYGPDLGRLKELLNSSIIELKSAEDILLVDNEDKYKKEIDLAYKSNKMKERIKLEEQGVGQIKQGRYKFK